jgi:hypothetical protein
VVGDLLDPANGVPLYGGPHYMAGLATIHPMVSTTMAIMVVVLDIFYFFIDFIVFFKSYSRKNTKKGDGPNTREG